jgi:predicted RNase H-related nuclease YkuK (DUF458 family)
MEIRKKFKKFGGEFIPDIIEYLKEQLQEDPKLTISVGCDSIQKRRRTVYAITIMLYNGDIRNGAHLVFFRESVDKIKGNFDRLQKEAEYLHDIGEFLNTELSSFYTREDLNDLTRKKYKLHLLKCNGEFENMQIHDEGNVIRNLTLTPADLAMNFKLVDLHLDFNPAEGAIDSRGYAKNRSNLSYKSFVPWLRLYPFLLQHFFHNVDEVLNKTHLFVIHQLNPLDHLGFFQKK